MSKTKTGALSKECRDELVYVLNEIESNAIPFSDPGAVTRCVRRAPWRRLFDAYELLETLCHEHGGQLVLRPSVVAALEHGAPDPGASDPALGQEIARYRFPIDLAAFSNANLALRDAYPNHVLAAKQIGQFGVVFARPKNGGQS